MKLMIYEDDDDEDFMDELIALNAEFRKDMANRRTGITHTTDELRQKLKAREQEKKPKPRKPR